MCSDLENIYFKIIQNAAPKKKKKEENIEIHVILRDLTLKIKTSNIGLIRVPACENREKRRKEKF